MEAGFTGLAEMQAKFLKIIEELAEKSWSYQPDFFPLNLIQNLLDEQKRLYAEGLSRLAGIGRGDKYQTAPNIRGDHILWFDINNLQPYQKLYCDAMEVFRQLLNRELYLGLQEFECHYAMYPPATFFHRHLDRFRSSNARIITVISYLNFDWQETDGGFLRMYLPPGGSTYQDIPPRSGGVVAFLSGEIEHEVIPTRKPRYSITGWFKKKETVF